MVWVFKTKLEEPKQIEIALCIIKKVGERVIERKRRPGKEKTIISH
jgi:hypothetical protein